MREPIPYGFRFSVPLRSPQRAEESMESRATRIIARFDDKLAVRRIESLGIVKEVMREISIFGEIEGE